MDDDYGACRLADQGRQLAEHASADDHLVRPLAADRDPRDDHGRGSGSVPPAVPPGSAAGSTTAATVQSSPQPAPSPALAAMLAATASAMSSAISGGSRSSVGTVSQARFS